jgi:hypothetical protein
MFEKVLPVPLERLLSVLADFASSAIICIPNYLFPTKICMYCLLYFSGDRACETGIHNGFKC